jgi:xylulokinase
MNALLGIDIGTQGTKAALFDEEGQCLASAFRKSALHQPRPGVVEESPEDQIDAVCHAIKTCITKARIDPGAVAGIGIDGQMAGILGVGKDGRHVTPYDSWLDTRCGPYIEEMARKAGKEIIRKTGGPPSFNHGPKMLWWRAERPRVYKTIRAFVQPGGYAVMRLCGMNVDAAFLDKSYLHFSGFADNRRGVWDPGLCEQFDIDPEKLPRIVNSHEIAGEISPAMARRCGLRPGVPVIAGCGDTAASFLACGATREGICVDVAGTAAVFATTTRTFRPDLRHRILGCGQAATPGLWHPYAYINGAGMNLEWFRTEVISRRGGKMGEATLAELDQAAASIGPDKTAPFFVPHLGGRVSPGWPRLRGSWAGLHWQHRSSDLYRSMLEAVALEYRIYQQVARELYPELRLTELRVTGGGEKSELWNRIKADVLQLPVVQIAHPEGAPLGAALLAGFGVGVFPDLDRAARKWIATGRRTAPDRKHARHYARRFDRYQELLELLNHWSEQ